MAKLTLELRLVDEMGRVHGVMCHDLPREAGYIGDRAVDDARFMGTIGAGDFGGMVRMMKAREFRKDLVMAAATQLGGALCDFLADREGWHGLDRQEATERYLKGR